MPFKDLEAKHEWHQIYDAQWREYCKLNSLCVYCAAPSGCFTLCLKHRLHKQTRRALLIKRRHEKMADLKVGDRVTRQIELGQPARKAGIIVNVYKTKQSSQTNPYNLYAIRWDGDEQIYRGYSAISLERE
jgi:hypothetical protein